MPIATYDDANLLLRLYELRREEKLRKAREWFGQSFRAGALEEFDQLCPMGSETNAYYRMVVSYWDMAASFVVTGVLNEELFFLNSREFLFVWERIKGIVPASRERQRNPVMYSNMEKVANRYAEWMSSRSPEAYQAFTAMVNARR
jgi:hypothetical protein